MKRREETRDFVIRLNQEAGGFVVSGRPKDACHRLGIDDTLVEQKSFRHREAAQAEFDHLRALALFWDAVLRFEPRRHLLRNVVRLEEESLRVRRAYNDGPVVPARAGVAHLSVVPN